MKTLILCLVIGEFVFYSCRDRVNTYENDMGIEPAVLAQMDSVNYTTIAWEDSVDNFGTVKEGDSVIVSFKFTNSGDKALFVSSAHSTCGCATVNYPKAAILPGKQGEVIARFQNKYKPGPVRQNVVVTTNTLNRTTHSLSFIGQVAEGAGH